MKKIKNILKWIVYLLAIPLLYLIISYILSAITINNKNIIKDNQKTIYLNTNGVHLDIVIKKKDLDYLLLKDLVYLEDEKYISFGWGEENFYINTPTWNDLTFKNAFSALFLKSTTLMHLTRYKTVKDSWVEVKIDKTELKLLNQYILESFKLDILDRKIILPNSSYTTHDNFYKANGSYSCLYTCNTWVNEAFKKAGLKACLWTPFDFGLINKYEEYHLALSEKTSKFV